MLFYQPNIPDGKHYLDPDETRHAIKVLRLATGDTITVADGKGKHYNARLTSASAQRCDFEIISVSEVPRRPFEIHIFIAPTKNLDRMEWFVEKVVEIGVERIHFFESKHSERKTINTERLQKKAVSAMKQSKQAWLPTISDIQPFASVLQFGSGFSKYLCHVDPKNTSNLSSAAQPGKKYQVLIGPEGDFSTEELGLAIDAGFKKVSLGPTTLRTETAGMVACTLLNLVNH